MRDTGTSGTMGTDNAGIAHSIPPCVPYAGGYYRCRIELTPTRSVPLRYQDAQPAQLCL